MRNIYSLRKKIVPALFLVAGVILTPNLYSQWIADSLSTNINLNSISICEEGAGWIVGNNGTMLYRNDNQWHLAESVTKANLFSVFMNSENDGWAVGSKGTILRYDGNAWMNVESPTREGLLSVSFNDPFNGVAVGVHGTIIIFRNGQWHTAEKLGMENLYCVGNKDDITVIGGGGEAVSVPLIKMRKLSGEIRVDKYNPNYVFIKSVFIHNKNNIWAVGLPGTIFHNNGSKWQKIKTPESVRSLNGICFSDETHGIAVGHNGTVLLYSEGIWKKEETPVNYKLNSVASIGDTFYVVGDKGVILSHTRKPEAIREKTLADNNQISIQNYPNPADSYIHFVVPEEFNGSNGQITISTSSGQIVYAMEVYEMMSNDIHQIGISNLSNGVYFLRIRSTTLSAAGKFIVQH